MTHAPQTAAPIVAVIPARGGSTRLKDKNILPVAGRPLLAWTVRQAVAAELISQVYVTTDSGAIAAVAEENGARVIARPPEIAGATASSESALLHALDAIEAETGPQPLVMLLQATSPVRRRDDIDNAIRQYHAEGADSLVSGCLTKHFLWRRGETGGYPVNYDPAHRPRSQDFEPQFQENGSIYISRADMLRRSNNRLGGRISIFEMDFWSQFEIDDQNDLELIDWIMRKFELFRQV